MILQLMDIKLPTTRHHWRKEMGLPEDVAKDPRGWLVVLAERGDARELVEIVAQRIAGKATSISQDLFGYLLDATVRHRNLRPDLVDAVKGSMRTYPQSIEEATTHD